MNRNLPPLRLSERSRQWVQLVTPKEPATEPRELYVPAARIRERLESWKDVEEDLLRQAGKGGVA
jgi:hypothetical protein